MPGFFRAWFAQLVFWRRRVRTRRQLRDLPPYLLDDIGLDAAARDDECAKWAWQGKPRDHDEAYAKENGRGLRAPVCKFAMVDWR